MNERPVHIYTEAGLLHTYTGASSPQFYTEGLNVSRPYRSVLEVGKPNQLHEVFCFVTKSHELCEIHEAFLIKNAKSSTTSSSGGPGGPLRCIRVLRVRCGAPPRDGAHKLYEVFFLVMESHKLCELYTALYFLTESHEL